MDARVPFGLVGISGARLAPAASSRLNDGWGRPALAVAMAVKTQQQESGVFTRMTPVVTEEDAHETIRQLRLVRWEARRRVTDDVLREVARIYRENVNRKPTSAVARHTERSHRTAALYVKQAREAGFLGPAILRKAGEQS